MPSQQQVQWSQLKVGVLILVALSALTALIFLMSGNTGGFFTGHITIRSYFEDSAGLKVGAPVNLDGVAIGSVKAIRISPDHKLTPVEVIMRIGKRYHPLVRSDARSSLETIGVLGDTVVNISGQYATGPPISDGGELQTTETPNLSDVIRSSQGTIEQLNAILAKVNNLVDSLNSDKGSIGMLINDRTLYNKAIGTLDQLQTLVNSVSSGKGSIGKLISDDTLYNRANDAIGHLQHVAAEIDSGQGTMGKLIKDPALYNNLERSSRNLNQILAEVNSGKGAIGMMAKDQAFANKLNNTVTQLNSLLAQINSGQGTVGKLVKDPALYNHTDEVMTSSSDLIQAIRKDPKKYLTIHLKIF
ncbi:MAG TPA: MlaD family protein [Acidobacteriaceae bacterium]|nr:MlaD family protein [Acidobacteriaceae bacterium]